MRRISRNWNDLSQQLLSAGRGISLEPSWPATAPTQVEVEAASAEITSLTTQIIAAENVLQGLRLSRHKAIEDGTQLMRRVDQATNALYGETGSQKITYGLRLKDQVRNSSGPTPAISKLLLTDGPVKGSISAGWKKVPRATYEVQWFSDEALESLMGATVAPQNQTFIPAAPGVQIWLRVRAMRGRRLGEWSEVVTRISNV